MKKQGIGHVEIVLAFILFIAAILFILSFVDIRQDTSAGEAALASVASLLQKEAETQLMTHTVIIKQATGDPPQQTPLILTIELPEDIKEEENIRAEAVTTSTPRKLRAQKHPTNAKQVVIERDSTDVTLVRVIISKDITAPPATLAAPPHNPAFYQSGSRTERLMLAETKLNALQESYGTDYDAFRKALGAGERIHLAFSISWQNPELAKQDFIKAERDIPVQTDVTAQTLRQELLLKDGQRVFADINMRVW